MVAYLAVLTAILLMLQAPALAASVDGQCRVCHTVHYGDKGRCTDCHRGRQNTSRKELAHSGLIEGRYASFTDQQATPMRSGKTLADKAACRRCHRLEASGNRLASDLDNLLWTKKTADIRKAIKDPVLFMPNFQLSDRDLDHLITAILAGGHRAGKIKREPPQIVHFSNTNHRQQNIFVQKCGGCHRMLSGSDGGLGHGTTGPNLSGLLSRFYPHNFDTGLPWDKDRLKRWLKNPRSIRANSTMSPVMLKENEWDQLLRTLAAGTEATEPGGGI